MGQVVAIIGAGRVGQAVGILLRRAGYKLGGVVSRSPDRAQAAKNNIGAGTALTDMHQAAHGADILFLTVPDGAIAPVAGQLAARGSLTRVKLLVHTSGALPAAALVPPAPARSTAAPTISEDWGQAKGPLYLSMHPIQSIAQPQGAAQQMEGSYWGLEGDEAALPMGEKLVRAMGGRPLTIKPGQKALYHAAAAVASNYLISLLDMAVQLAAKAGLPDDAATAALASLMAGTLANAREVGLPAALTGPIERGDAATVARHLDGLANLPPNPTLDQTASLYRQLGQYTVGLARRKGQRDTNDVHHQHEKNLNEIAALLEGRSVNG